MATPPAPMYKPQNEEFFVFTNVGAKGNFGSKATIKNTIQMEASKKDFQDFMGAFPEETHQFYEAKGMFVLSFENTIPSSSSLLPKKR